MRHAALGLFLVLLGFSAASEQTLRIGNSQSCEIGDGRHIDSVCLVNGPGEAVWYGHGVLGDVPEWRELWVMTARKRDPNHPYQYIVLEDGIFEDIRPRLVDFDGDGIDEILVVRSDFEQGARLELYAVFPTVRLIAAGDYIGTRFRWLAPAGVADFDGDGQLDIAYVDRPHLAKTLRIVTRKGDRLVEIASARGFSNHRIGENFISGGLRDCGDGPQIVLANAGWRRVLAARLESGEIVARDLGAFDGPAAFDRALAC